MLRLGNTAKRLLILMTLLSGQIIFGTPVFGVTNPSITINLGSMPSLNLMSGSFGSVSQSVEVITNNYTGCAVNLENTVNDTALVNTTNSSLTIPTITLPSGSSSITSSDFTSGYGISTDGTHYVPAPTSSNSIALGTSNAAGTNSYTLTFGAKPAADAATGTYSRTFIVTVVVNNPQYSITYNANAGNDTVTGMPSNQSTTISSTGTVTLPNNEPTRSGYNFLGWDTNSAATTPTYPTGSTNTITLEPTQANAITLYAIWQQGSSGGGGTWDTPVEDNTTQTYNPNDVPIGTTEYTEIAGQPRVTKDEDGNIVRFEYMDASAGVSLSSALNTGVLAFDDDGFTIWLDGAFPWTTQSLSPVISLSGLVNNYASGVVLNAMYNSSKQTYTNTSGSKVSSATYVNKFRSFEYSGTNSPTNRNIVYSSSPTANVSNTNQNTLGWIQSQAPLNASIEIVGTPTNNAMNIEIRIYNYDTTNGRGSLIGILPANYVYSISGLESSGITIELGHYKRSSTQEYSYAYTIYGLSIQKDSASSP